MSTQTHTRQPNIILILADDMGYGDFGVFNDGKADTPALDRIVNEGVCLRQHYSGSPVCAPARAALMTGRYPHRTGAIDTYEARGLDRLSLRERTMADVLGDAGYTTGLIGKWHLGALDPRYHPNARGFDEFAGFRGGWHDYWAWRLDRNGTHENSDGRYLTDVLSDEAVGYVQRHAQEDSPFFLHVTYNAPHWPYQCPEADLQYFRDRGCTEGQAMIYGMIRRMDIGIAQIMDELEAQGIADDTIIMFTSDNGPDLSLTFEYDVTRYNMGFNGAKTWTYEGGIRVPMAVRWPNGGLSGGRMIDDNAHFTDWLPTLAAAAGTDAPTDRRIDGRNILPMLRDEGPVDDVKRFWQWNRWTPVIESNAAARDGDWKLVRPKIAESFNMPDGEGDLDLMLKYEPEKVPRVVPLVDFDRPIPPPPPAELYNIAEDPGEQNDLAKVDPSRYSRMLSDLEGWFEEVEAERAAIDDLW
jgi:arylsulfatase A-like enzyme